MYEYAAAFRSDVKLEPDTLDLASMQSVMDSGRMMTQKHEYISHLILNTGTTTYSHIDIVRYVSLSFESTHPRSNIQKNGVLSDDNLGYVWQCNLFGHYCVYRSLQPLLVAYHLTKTLHSYEGSKFEIDVIASELERLVIDAEVNAATPFVPDFILVNREVHHLLSHQKTSAAFVFWITRRVFGCRDIHLSSYSSAIATVHLTLSPLKSIRTACTATSILPGDEKYPPWHAYYNLNSKQMQTLRMGSEASAWGYEYTGIIAVPVWEEHPDFEEKLLEKCERLY